MRLNATCHYKAPEPKRGVMVCVIPYVQFTTYLLQSTAYQIVNFNVIREEKIYLRKKKKKT